MLAMNNVVKAWTPCVVSNTPKLCLKVIRGLHTCKFNDFGITQVHNESTETRQWVRMKIWTCSFENKEDT
jgi:hypothetical protein